MIFRRCPCAGAMDRNACSSSKWPCWRRRDGTSRRMLASWLVPQTLRPSDESEPLRLRCGFLHPELELRAESSALLAKLASFFTLTLGTPLGSSSPYPEAYPEPSHPRSPPRRFASRSTPRAGPLWRRAQAPPPRPPRWPPLWRLTRNSSLSLPSPILSSSLASLRSSQGASLRISSTLDCSAQAKPWRRLALSTPKPSRPTPTCSLT
mmetsp:Transcript_6413/g.18789  ORF Transcript_6413/g.18789 Transcript_6413/m.18789 type:complete len:208 (+) Transcript_6413:549-1172(+)